MQTLGIAILIGFCSKRTAKVAQSLPPNERTQRRVETNARFHIDRDENM